MRAVKRTGQFDKSIILAKKRGRNIDELEALVELLRTEKPLPQRCKDHRLVGNYHGLRELKIKPDWLLVYRIHNNELHLIDTGTHSDLFK